MNGSLAFYCGLASNPADGGKIPSVQSFGNLSEVSCRSDDTVDERTAKQVTAAKEAVLASAHDDFVAAVLGVDAIADSLVTKVRVVVTQTFNLVCFFFSFK